MVGANASWTGCGGSDDETAPTASCIAFSHAVCVGSTIFGAVGPTGRPNIQSMPIFISDTPMTRMMVPVTTGGKSRSSRLMNGAIRMVVNHLSLQRFIEASRRDDLRQEAGWVARHWRADTNPEQLARAWGATHDSVRLIVLDSHGRTIADSRPSAPRPHGTVVVPVHGRGRLSASAPIAVPGGTGSLVLSWVGMIRIPIPLTNILLTLLLIVGLMVLAIYPMVRHLTLTFGQLAQVARRVADGQFGATLETTGQRELSGLISSFNDMSVRLEQQEQRKRQLIADVSHELRSPMARLRALGETIARRPADAGDQLGQLDAEIGLMDRLIGDMLQAARLDSGAAGLNLQATPLGAWAADAFARSRTRIEPTGATCVATLEPISAEVEIDGQRLFQAMGNLVENAVTATAGRPNSRIALELSVSPTAWCVSVSDNGPGIPAEDLPFVFDRCFRGERHRGHGSGGIGLGLAIARSIVELHGGGLTIESSPGEGVTARFCIPFDRPATQFPDTSAKTA